MTQRRFVLDSYAVLAFLEDGSGGRQVRELLAEALAGRVQLFMSVINLGEVLYITERERSIPKAQEILARIEEFPVEVIAADRDQVLVAAHIKANWPMAYADCFAVALAKLKQAAVVTGDPEFRQLETAGIVSVVWLGED